MSLNHTPASERIHIGFFGNRNAGKSSLVNAVSGQELSIVSNKKGTTTDPVQKAMELLPIGPVVIIDTPGIDDCGELGELRVKRTRRILNKTNLAVLVVDASKGMDKNDEDLVLLFKENKVAFIIVHNKADLLLNRKKLQKNEIYASAKTGYQIHELKEKIAAFVPKEDSKQKLVADLLSPHDLVILVVPIDSAAPKGRLILPQQQTIRDILEAEATAMVLRENELNCMLQNIGLRPKLVITDSQIFERVDKDLDPDIPLTSFSILFARYKGELAEFAAGVKELDNLSDGDCVLISEGCTHHRQCGDIGTVKLPEWIRNYTKKEISFEFTSGMEFHEELDRYKLIIHCGGCMLNEKEMKSRMRDARKQKAPMTNYGMAIARMKGILERSLGVFEAGNWTLEKR